MAKEQPRLGTMVYDGNFGLRTPTLPDNWANVLAAWDEKADELIKEAEANRGGRYEVVWSAFDSAKALRGQVKKLVKEAIHADEYPETKGALPWLFEAARWSLDAERCAATAAGVVRGQEKIGMAPMDLEPASIADFATDNGDGTVTVTVETPDLREGCPHGVVPTWECRVCYPGGSDEAASYEAEQSAETEDEESPTPDTGEAPDEGESEEQRASREAAEAEFDRAIGYHAPDPDVIAEDDADAPEEERTQLCPICFTEQHVVGGVFAYHRYSGRDCEGSGSEAPTWVVEQS